MARLRGHRALDFEQPVYVRAPVLKGWGRIYKRGEEFPWRELKIVPRKVHQLWMQRAIGHERLGDPPQGAEAPHPKIALPLMAPVVVTPLAPAGAEERDPVEAMIAEAVSAEIVDEPIVTSAPTFAPAKPVQPARPKPKRF